MAPKADRPPRKDWYSISVETLRTWALVLVLGALAAVGYRLYRNWELKDLQRDAVQTIQEAATLEQQVRKSDVSQAKNFAGEVQVAREKLAAARAELEKQAFREALRDSQQSRDLLRNVLDASTLSASSGKAQFISVQGEVEFRRASSDTWEEARNKLALRPGDYVRTSSSGSAEIVFVDGTFYTVKPNTQFVVSAVRNTADGATEQAIQMEYGWVNLNTSSRPSKVQTPGAEARIGQDSEAYVAFDKDAKKGRFGAVAGSVEVAAGGQKREIKALQQVVQNGTLLSEPTDLPPRPILTTPLDNADFDPARDGQLVLAWEPVRGAARYNLQVARNHLFVDNVIEANDRAKTRATLSLRGEGSFLWRVAGVTGGSVAGPWSEPRRFRVVSFRAGAGESDAPPPELEIETAKSYGNICIVVGKTDPGASLVINGEPLKADASGAFTKTVQLNREGWNFIEIKARNASGKETVQQRRVFVENP